jgi:hypothetical protein
MYAEPLYLPALIDEGGQVTWAPRSRVMCLGQHQPPL